MKTKLYRKFTIAFVSLLFFTGCSSDFLDMEQPGVKAVTDYYKTDADATGAILSCYNMMRAMNGSDWTCFWLVKECLSDDIYTGGADAGDQPGYQELNKFTFDASNPFITNVYKYSYMVIYRANMIVDNFKDPTPYQKIVIAEAKAIRAYMYFELATLYGNVPLVLHELLPTEYAQPNSAFVKNGDGTITPTGLYAQIEKDLTEAMVDLPLKSQLKAEGSDVARFSKGTAQAFLGKTQLYEKKYTEAAATLNALIDTKEYGLYQLSEINNDYTQLLRKSTEFGKESIFEISFSSERKNDWNNAFGDVWVDPSRTNPSNVIWVLCGPRNSGFNGPQDSIVVDGKKIPNLSSRINSGWGFGYPTLDLWKAYKDAGDSVRVHGVILTESQLIEKGGTMLVKDEKPGGNLLWGCPGLVRLKYTTWEDETTAANGAIPELCYGTNLRIIRYSDVLLMAAEANLLATTGGDLTKALDQINQVRTRVNLQPLGSLTLADIKLERRLELSFEGCRYQDLVRWGDAANTLKNQGKSVPSGIRVNGVLQFIANSAAGFVAPKNNMFPIPFNEMSSNPNVKQNPGY